MQVDERGAEALTDGDLLPLSGEPRLQYSAPWLAFCASRLAPICGHGSSLSVLAACVGDEIVAALPMVRTSATVSPRPFPWDFEDFFFGLWIRNWQPSHRVLRARATLARAFAAVLGAVNPALRRTLILHAPLAPISEVLVAAQRPRTLVRQAVQALLARARQLAADEGRCAFVPRVRRRDAALWADALTDWTRVESYSVAEYLPAASQGRHLRQMLTRNRRLVDRAGVTVEISPTVPAEFPMGALFAKTTARYRDPAPALDDVFFHELGACIAPRTRFLCVQRAGCPVGFLAVLEHDTFWEAFKCGMDREVAAPAPIYLDLVYGRLRELAATARIARVELGPGALDVKQHYGAHVHPIDSFVALPPGFRGRAAFTAYLRAVGAGIARHELIARPAVIAKRPAGLP